MAQKIKYTQKELKRNDKFREIAAKGLNVLIKNFNKILIFTGLVIIILIGIYFYSNFKEKETIEANKMFDSAFEKFQNGNQIDALNEFDLLTKEFPNEKISTLALYYAGVISNDLGNYEGSIHYLNKFLKNNSTDQLLNDAALYAIGLSSYNLENWENSIKYLSQINSNGSPYEHNGKLHLGFAYEKIGQKDKAEEIFNEILINQSAAGNSVNLQ